MQRRFRPALLVLLLPALVAALPATARQLPCAAREHVVAVLVERFGESRQGMGVSGGGNVLEVYAAPETGSWTVLVTRPDGTSCIIASGLYWQGPDPARLPGRAS